MLRTEELAAECRQHRRKIAEPRILRLEKGPHAAPLRLETAQGQHEIAQVAAVERAVGIGGEQVELAIG